MNPDSHDLIQRHMAGLLDEEEAAALQRGLKTDPELRRLYLHYMNLDVALAATADAVVMKRTIVALEEHRAARLSVWAKLSLASLPIGAAAAVAVMLLPSRPPQETPPLSESEQMAQLIFQKQLANSFAP